MLADRTRPIPCYLLFVYSGSLSVDKLYRFRCTVWLARISTSELWSNFGRSFFRRLFGWSIHPRAKVSEEINRKLPARNF